MKRLYVIVTALLLASLAFSLVPAIPASAAPAQTAAGSGCAQFYVVRHGDNLFRIALRFHTTVPALMALNGLPNPNLIYAGMTLCVKKAAPIPMGFLYIICPGDTLYSIAMRFGWSVSYLAAVNHISYPGHIYAGQILLIPYH